jgi:hypothetical protein
MFSCLEVLTYEMILVAQSKEERERLARDKVNIMNWVSPLNFNLVQDEIFAKRTPGTGLELLQSPVFTRWMETRGETLWCHGIRKFIAIQLSRHVH